MDKAIIVAMAISFGYWLLTIALGYGYCLWLWILATSYKYLHNGLLWVQLLAMDKG
jgi:hypothetical protein